MFEVQKTDEFDQWLAALRDQRAVAKIASRAMGNAGDVKAVGAGVSELRVEYGPGYRVSQDRDIRHAKAIAAQL